MGIFRDVNNRKKTTEKERHSRRWKRQAKAALKAAKGPTPINIEDPELYSTKMLKNKLQNPRNNIKVSGRNRKKQLKRLKYQMRDEQREAGEEKKDFEADLFMEDEEETAKTETETPTETETTEMAESSASASGSNSNKSNLSSSGTDTATTTTKKKKRGGKKKNKGKGNAGGAEDVEMEELFTEPKWD